MSNLIRNWNSRNIRIRSDRYVSLTDMAQATSKRVNNWLRLDSTKSYLEALSRSTQIATVHLVQVVQGGEPKNQGTWGHPEVVKEFERWCFHPQIDKSSKRFESSVRDDLANTLQGKIEVPCKSGIVDIVTSTEIVEVKSIKNWKDAIGQALVYSCEFPNKTPRIHLFGEASTEYRLMIVSFCSQLKVAVTFEV